MQGREGMRRQEHRQTERPQLPERRAQIGEPRRLTRWSRRLRLLAQARHPLERGSATERVQIGKGGRQPRWKLKDTCQDTSDARARSEPASKLVGPPTTSRGCPAPDGNWILIPASANLRLACCKLLHIVPRLTTVHTGNFRRTSGPMWPSRLTLNTLGCARFSLLRRIAPPPSAIWASCSVCHLWNLLDSWLVMTHA